MDKNYYSTDWLSYKKTAYYLLQSLRPRQWIKNSFILVPLIFAQRLFDHPSLMRSLAAMAIFCLVAGSVYLMNDLRDLDADQEHPVKRYRPLAAGLITPQLIKVTVAILLPPALLFGYFVGEWFLFTLLCYLTVQALYNYRLKEVVILDVFCISAGFFLRVIAGAVAIQVEVSPWLIICSIMLSMFLALAKRRHELVVLGKARGENHRKILAEYSPYLLDQMIAVITAGTLLTYLLYSVSPETIEKFGTDNLIFSFPFVMYGIFRYLYLIHSKNEGGAPEKVIMTDYPLLVNVVLWGLVCLLIVYGYV